jgi:hypothetical protein
MEYLYSSTYTIRDVEPDFSLPILIKVFYLAIELRILGLEELSVAKFRHNLNNYVTNLEVFYSAVKRIYTHRSSSYGAGEHTGLRLAVVEAAISEMSTLLTEGPREGFFQCTKEVPDFQADLYLIMLPHPTRPLEVVSISFIFSCPTLHRRYTSHLLVQFTRFPVEILADSK